MSRIATTLNSKNEVMVTVNPGKDAHMALISFRPRDSKSFRMTVVTDDATRTFVVVVDNASALAQAGESEMTK